MTTWHLAGCHEVSKHWCDLLGGFELFVGVPVAILLFWLTIASFTRSVGRVWAAATLIPLIAFAGSLGALAVILLTGPWW